VWFLKEMLYYYLLKQYLLDGLIHDGCLEAHRPLISILFYATKQNDLSSVDHLYDCIIVVQNHKDRVEKIIKLWIGL
jgi:hypothetical protein